MRLCESLFCSLADCFSTNPRAGAHLAALQQHTARSLLLLRRRVSAACAPSDINWPNVGRLSHFQQRVARAVVGVVVGLLCLFFMIPIVLVQSLATISNLSKFFPPIVGLLKVKVVRSIIEGVLPGLVLIIFFALLPPLMRFLSAKEGIYRESRLDVAQVCLPALCLVV